jgi:hypothetical protein
MDVIVMTHVPDFAYTAATLPIAGLRDARAHVPLKDCGVQLNASLQGLRTPIRALDVAVDGVPGVCRIMCRERGGRLSLTRAEFLDLGVTLDVARAASCRGLPHALMVACAGSDEADSDVLLSLAYLVYEALLLGAAPAPAVEALWGWGVPHSLAHAVFMKQLAAGAPEADDETALHACAGGTLSEEEVRRALDFMRVVRCTLAHMRQRVSVLCL